jgi:hypothetical protein
LRLPAFEVVKLLACAVREAARTHMDWAWVRFAACEVPGVDAFVRCAFLTRHFYADRVEAASSCWLWARVGIASRTVALEGPSVRRTCEQRLNAADTMDVAACTHGLVAGIGGAWDTIP